MPGVGLTLTTDHALTVVAPHGLRVRHNPARATVEQFMARHTCKHLLEQWPRLCVVGLGGWRGSVGLAVHPMWLEWAAHGIRLANPY